MARLHLTTLTLARFRSHRAMRLDLDGRTVVLVGPNGAGKTNILEAVSMLSPGRGLRGAAPAEIARTPDTPGLPGNSGWKVTAALQTPNGLHEIETFAEGAGRQVRLDGKPAPQAALAAVAPLLWLTPAMDRLWTEAPEGRRRFLDRMTLTLFPGHAALAATYERALRERNRLLRDGVANAGWLGAIEARMAQAGAGLAANRRAALARILAAQGLGGFPRVAAQIDEGAALPDTAEGLAHFWAGARRRDLEAGRTLAGPHRADLAGQHAEKGVPAQSASTGEQKALMISLVLGNARAFAQQSGAPPILLLDEVAAHLDATRRAALHEALQALGAQAFLTGTELAPFSPWAGTAQHLHLREAGGASVVET